MEEEAEVVVEEVAVEVVEEEVESHSQGLLPWVVWRGGGLTLFHPFFVIGPRGYESWWR